MIPNREQFKIIAFNDHDHVTLFTVTNDWYRKNKAILDTFDDDGSINPQFDMTYLQYMLNAEEHSDGSVERLEWDECSTVK